jgi:hypothetical protein
VVGVLWLWPRIMGAALVEDDGAACRTLSKSVSAASTQDPHRFTRVANDAEACVTASQEEPAATSVASHRAAFMEITGTARMAQKR